MGRKIVIKILMAISLIWLSGSIFAQQKPPVNNENWGVCPFECCTYRDWTAQEDIPVHRRRDDKSTVIFHLQRDEQVAALTGVVVTEKPAIITINKTVEDGFIKDNDTPQLTLHAGDIVYMLTPLGEGVYLFWYQGKIYQSGNSLAAMPGVAGKEGVMTWWKLVRNSAGKMGWTRSNKFKNVDACG